MKSLNIFLLGLLAPVFFAACSSSDKSEDQEAKFVTKAGPAIQTKTVEYSSGGKTLKGFLAIPEGEGPFPGVLVVHEWWGQTDYPRQRAVKLAEEGYMALAVDMYGEGQTAEHPDDAKKFSKKVMEDMDLAEESFRTALATLRAQDNVDKSNVAAVGYCFGGAIVLEMARRNVDLKMVASYHGDLTPLVQNEIPNDMKARLLIFNGAADPFVPKKAVSKALSKLKEAKKRSKKVRYKFVNYQGAKHGFTNPEATANGEKFKLPLAYDERADQASWQETLKAFKIVFK